MSNFITRIGFTHRPKSRLNRAKIANCVTFLCPLKSLENLLKTSKDKGFGEGYRACARYGRSGADIAGCAAGRAAFTAIAAANIRDDGELVVLASSSAWASRLRL